MARSADGDTSGAPFGDGVSIEPGGRPKKRNANGMKSAACMSSASAS